MRSALCCDRFALAVDSPFFENERFRSLMLRWSNKGRRLPGHSKRSEPTAEPTDFENKGSVSFPLHFIALEEENGISSTNYAMLEGPAD